MPAINRGESRGVVSRPIINDRETDREMLNSKWADMTRAHLYRYRHTNTHTLGVLVIGGEVLHTLERPWKNNEKNISCIPAGEYRVVWIPQSASGKYKNIYHVTSVTGRSGILIHNGNIADHTKGCILLGDSTGILLNQPAVLSSHSAMRRLQKFKDSFILKVI